MCAQTPRLCRSQCDGALQEAIKRGAFLMPPSRGPERPNIAALLTTAAEIAAGMAFLHARGIIHGDLSGCARPFAIRRFRNLVCSWMGWTLPDHHMQVCGPQAQPGCTQQLCLRSRPAHASQPGLWKNLP